MLLLYAQRPVPRGQSQNPDLPRSRSRSFIVVVLPPFLTKAPMRSNKHAHICVAPHDIPKVCFFHAVDLLNAGVGLLRERMNDVGAASDDEADEAYSPTNEEVKFALQQARPTPCVPLNEPLSLAVALQALALNDKLLRMELEVSAQQQRQQQHERQRHSSSPPLPPLHEEPPEGRPRGSGAAAARAKKVNRVPSQLSLDRTRAIERDNAHLLKHITEISAGPRSQAGSQTSSQRVANPKRASTPRRGSEFINRQRMEDKIALENARMARRLAGAKPHISYFKDAGMPGRNRGPRVETRLEREERHTREKQERERRSQVGRCSLPAPQHPRSIPAAPPTPAPPPPATPPPPQPVSSQALYSQALYYRRT